MTFGFKCWTYASSKRNTHDSQIKSASLVGVWARGPPLAIMLAVTLCALALSMLKMFGHRLIFDFRALHTASKRIVNSHQDPLKSPRLGLKPFPQPFWCFLWAWRHHAHGRGTASNQRLVNPDRCSEPGDHTCCFPIGWDLNDPPPLK